MQGIDIRVKWGEAPFADWKILPLFFLELRTIRNKDKRSAFAILYSCYLIQNSGIAEISTHEI